MLAIFFQSAIFVIVLAFSNLHATEYFLSNAFEQMTGYSLI